MCEKSKVLKSCLVKCSFSRNRAGSPPLLFRLGLLVRPLQIIGSLSHRGWKRQHQGAQVDKLATVDNLKLWRKSSLPLWLDLQLYKERIIMRRSIKCTKPYMDPWYYFESTNVNLFCITGIKVGVQQESCSNHYSKQLSCWTPTLIKKKKILPRVGVWRNNLDLQLFHRFAFWRHSCSCGSPPPSLLTEKCIFTFSTLAAHVF